MIKLRFKVDNYDEQEAKKEKEASSYFTLGDWRKKPKEEIAMFIQP